MQNYTQKDPMKFVEPNSSRNANTFSKDYIPKIGRILIPVEAIIKEDNTNKN